MAKYNKTDWSGGINQFADATKVDASSQFYFLSNGRTRRNRVEPIRKPLEITEDLPDGNNVQGFYSVDYYLVAFIDGAAYYRDYTTVASGAPWIRIEGLQMSATAERIYMTVVPASSVNFTRKAVDDTDAKQGIRFGVVTSGSPQCAVVMDGESQPWVIFPDASARVVSTWKEWSTTNREYVPAACILPLWFGEVLYCVGKDANGVYNKIYRSVSGRPLDFVIPVDESGGKTSDSENIGGAPAMSYDVDYGTITALASVQSNGQAFLATTARNSYLVIPDTTDLRFGEPRMTRQPLFPVGALNEQCVVDVLADTAVVHFSGIRSFNAILNLKFEGKNAPFSRMIDGLISDITQTHAATVSYDNYAAFSVTTRYGSAILWYDTLTEQYVSVDQFEGVGLVKQFAVLLTRTDRRLFFVTVDNRMFEYFGDTDIAPCRVYPKDFTPTTLDAEHAIGTFRGHFTPPLTAGYVQASIITDGRLVATRAHQVSAAELLIGDTYPIPYPISSDGSCNNLPIQFGFKEAACQGFRTGLMLEWNCDAALLAASIELNESTANMPESLKSNVPTRVIPTTIVMIGNDGDAGTSRIALNRAIKSLNPDYVVGLGNHAYNSGSQSDIDARFTPYWGNLLTLRKFYAAPGANDLDTDAGEPFFSTLRQAPTRYFKLSTTWADVFIMNSGYKSDGTQIEPDNLDGPTIAESAQMRWLEAQLAASTKHKLVIWYKSPYSSVDGGSAAMAAVPLASWGAIAQISASGRAYERFSVDGLQYITCGCGTGDYLAATPTTVAADSQALKTATAGYLRMRVYPLLIECAFVDVNGVEYDNYILRR